MAKTLYRHPDSGTIRHDAKARKLTMWDGEKSVSLPIGEIGLVELGRALIELGRTNAADDELFGKMTPADDARNDAHAAATAIYFAGTLDEARAAVAEHLTAAFESGCTHCAARAVADELTGLLVDGMAAWGEFVGSAPGLLVSGQADEIELAHKGRK